MLCPDGPRRDSYRPLLFGNLGSDLREFIDEDEILVFLHHETAGKAYQKRATAKARNCCEETSQKSGTDTAVFRTDYPDLKDRRILIVDDEADLASIRFVRKKDPQEKSRGVFGGI